MPCMCGDPVCSFCGPAQGNHRCYVCGEWESEGGCKAPAKCRAEEAKLAAHERRIEAAIERAEKEYNAHMREVMDGRAIEEEIAGEEDEDDTD